jgi:hypothetical protein
MIHKRGRAFQAILVSTLLWLCARIAITWDVTPSFIDTPDLPPSTANRNGNETLLVVIQRSLGQISPKTIMRAKSALNPSSSATKFKSRQDSHMAATPETIAKASTTEEVKSRISRATAARDRFPENQIQTTRKNLALSAWLFWRNERAVTTLVPNGQLGGSQIGVRAQKPLLSLGENQNLAATFRLSAPLTQKNGKEAAIGLNMKLAHHHTIEILAERRIRLDKGGRNAFAFLAAGGFYEMPLGHGLHANGYVQAGVAGIKSKDLFADGGVTLEHRLRDEKTDATSLGFGIWGATQPNLSRLDVGPLATIVLNRNAMPLRISAQWRLRIAGDARPVSGPALSIGSDF